MSGGGQAKDEMLGGSAGGPEARGGAARGPRPDAAGLIARAASRGESSLSLAGSGLDQLPVALKALSGLSRLDLSDNRLTELPEWIGGLTGLEELLLGGNRLMRLPETLGRLTRLVRLDVSGNRLVQIPAGLADLPHLSMLGLSGNPYLLVPPPAVVQLGSDAVLAFLRGYDPPAGPAQPTLPFEAGRRGPWRFGHGAPKSAGGKVAGRAREPEPRPQPQLSEGDQGPGIAGVGDDGERPENRTAGEALVERTVPGPAHDTHDAKVRAAPAQEEQQARQEQEGVEPAPAPDGQVPGGDETVVFEHAQSGVLDPSSRSSEPAPEEAGASQIELLFDHDGDRRGDSDGDADPEGPGVAQPWPKRRRRLILTSALLVAALLSVALASAAGGGGGSAHAVQSPGPVAAQSTSGQLESASAETASPSADAEPTLSASGAPSVAAAPAGSPAPALGAPAAADPADLAGLKPTGLAATFNNVGISADDDTLPGNFDGNNSSFSQTALDNDGASPGASVDIQGLDYTFPAAAAGTADNTVSNGQVIALSGEHSEFGLLLADDYGSTQATATVYYTDGTEQQINIVGQDWLANTPPGGANSTIGLTMPYLNRPGNTTNGSTVYIFSEEFALDSAKTLYAVRLPALGPMAIDSTSIHIFALAVG